MNHRSSKDSTISLRKTLTHASMISILAAGNICYGQTLIEAEDLSSLSDTDVAELEETTVIGTSNETPWLESAGSTLRFGRNDFISQGGSDFGDIAKYDPSISAPYNFASSDGTFGYGQTGYAGYNIRGIEGNRVLMLVDGIRQPEQFVSTSFGQDEGSAGGAGRDYYDPAMFEVTEILKGSASALYGSDAMAGVVSFRTPDPSDLLANTNKNYGGMLRAQYFGHNESFAEQGFFAYEKDQLSFLLGYARRDGSETKNNGVTPPNPGDFTSNSYLLKALWNNQNGHQLKFTYEHFNRKRFVDAQSARDFVATFDKFIRNWEEQKRDRYSINWDFTPDEPVSTLYDSVENMLYYQTTENGSQNHSESIFGRIRTQNILFETEILGLRSTFRKEKGRHFLTYGIDASVSDSENSFVRNDNGLFASPNRISFAPSTTTRASGFIQTEFSPKEESNWSFVLGGRLDYYHINPQLSAAYLDRINNLSAGRTAFRPAEDLRNLTFSPRIDILYKINEQSTAYAKYSNGVRNPSAEELSMIFDHPPSGGSPAGTLTLPNPSLKEETSHSFEVGYKYADDHSKFHAAAFYTRYSNFIENGVRIGATDPSGRDIVSTVNRGSATMYGYELSGSTELAKWFNKLDGLELGFSTGQTWGIDNASNTWINSVEPWKATAWLGYNDADDNFGARLTGALTGKVKHVNDQDGGPFFRPPSHFTLDLSAYYRVNDNVTIQFGINNLLDKQYYQWGGSRRAGGHISNRFAVSDRSTAPGRNAYLSVTFDF